MPEEINISSIHSDDVNDIIGRSPSWILTRGNIIIALIVFLLIAGASFLRYPDIISAPVLISSYDPPVKLIAQSSGKILHFYAQDGDQVDANKIIAVIDNPANTTDMLNLRDIVESIDTTLDIRKTIASIKLSGRVQVGEMQADYSTLYEAINNYNFFLNNAYYANVLATIGTEEHNNGRMEETIKERAQILSDQLKAEAWKDSVNNVLLREKVISLSEYNQIRKDYLSQHLNTEDNLTALLQNHQQRKELQKSHSDMQQQYRTSEKDVILAVKSAAKKIKGQTSIWEKQYVLKTPSAGKLVFFRIRKINQYVNSGEPVFMVVPVSQQFEIHVQLPLYKAGKVKTGQRVLLKLQEYPFEEYGMLKANVASITNVAIDSAYSVELKLQNGLTTTRNLTIEFRPEITGTADIITNDKSILQRIFEGLYGKLHQR
jgi:multidrug efflux pump subunit AcrA (membrane-fusion protein)